MENGGSGTTTMSPGIKSPVAGSIASEARESARTEQSRSVSASEQNKNVALEGKIVEFPKDKIVSEREADDLINIAKKDSVDRALESLAYGDDILKEDVVKGDIIEFPKRGDKQLKEGEAATVKEQGTNKKELPLEQQVMAIRERVENLMTYGDNLREALAKSQELNLQSQLTMQELIELFKKLLDKKDEDEKGLLQIVAELVAKMMEAMFVPQEGDGVLDGQSKEERLLEKKAA